MTVYIGYCFDSEAWGGDVTGILAKVGPDGETRVDYHISSSEAWSERDIRAAFNRRADPHDDDTFEWQGLRGDTTFTAPTCYDAKVETLGS